MKRALCVGINDYPLRGSDLRGCVNDATAWSSMLSDHFGFASGDIEMITDKTATKQTILAKLDHLLAGAKRNDVLVFTVSSHGTYLADTDGDEGADGARFDEAICPWDMKDNLIVDDELRQRFSNLPTSVRLTMISDSCYSGSVSRGPAMPTPDDRRSRFVDPSLLGLRQLPPSQIQAARSSRRVGEKFPESKMREVLLSGCRDNQTSFDANIGGTYHGAMSFFAQQLIGNANYDLTYRQLWDQLVVRIDREGYPQEPQMEGKPSNLDRRLFT